MPSRIEYSPKAVMDLDEIFSYIEKELCSPRAAQNTVNGILDAIDALAMFPESGAKLQFDCGMESGYRFVTFRNYLAFYRLRPNHVIEVDRVLYAGRDYMRMLFPEL